jgi:carboxylesterase
MRRTSLVFIVALLFLVACSPPADLNTPLPAEGNQPFTIDRGDQQGILLIHGLTATPWEVRPLADYLAGKNITVMAPLLPGHGTTMADLKKARWEDWVASANESLGELKKKTKRVYIGGVSTGADIAVLLASQNDVDGVVLISTPIEFRDWRAKFAGVYQYLLPYASHDVVGPEIGHYYSMTPSHSVAELISMVGHVKTELPRVKAPALILQSIHDKTVDPTSASFVFQNIGSTQKELRLYGNASHVLVQEQDAPDIIFYSVGEFLGKN